MRTTHYCLSHSNRTRIALDYRSQLSIVRGRGRVVRIVKALNYCFLGRAKRRPNHTRPGDQAEAETRRSTRAQLLLKAVGMMAPRSRSMRLCGGGVDGGVMTAGLGMGIILMLSSASAPSRVPQVVWGRALLARWPSCRRRREGAGLTYLCDGDAAIQLDEIVEVPEQNRHGHEADVARVS